MCWRNFCNFSLVTKKCEKLVKNGAFFFLFQKSSISKFEFQKENNYLGQMGQM